MSAGVVPVDALGWIHSLRFQDLPASVVKQAKRCTLDLLGTAAAGSQTELATIVCRFAAAQLGALRGARILFRGARASPTGAAFAGASTIDAFDAHDGHALTKGHAGVAILPTLLALADAHSAATGRELLTSLVIGYEVAIRAGITLHASTADYHTSGAWNALACAAVASRHLRLDRASTRHALGIAEYHGPRSQMMRCIAHPTMVKDGSGWGALAGLSAAYLAADGFTGAPALLLEDPANGAIWEDLGLRWRILELYFKPYPVCRWAQPAMQAAAALMRERGIAPGEIERITVATFAEAAALGISAPTTTEQAQYSLPLPLAALLLHGRVGPDEIGPAGLADPAALNLAAKVEIVADPVMSARFPSERWAQVTIATANGQTATSGPATAPGDPEDPMPDAELTAKFHGLAAQLAPIRRERIAACVEALDQGGSLTPLLDDVLI